MGLCGMRSSSPASILLYLDSDVLRNPFHTIPPPLTFIYMKNRHIHIIIGFLLFGFFSCIGIKTLKQTTYIGNFRESNYGFFESFRHTNDQDYYYNLPFELKFGGIRPYPFDSVGKQDYSWLRNPTNLKIAFNSILLIGLDKFVSLNNTTKLIQIGAPIRNGKINHSTTS